MANTESVAINLKRRVPIGARCISSCFTVKPERRENWYKASVLVLTFLAYASYHLAKRPVSTVKGTWNPNCTVVKVNNTCDAWAPFTQRELSKELFGTLDSAFLYSYALAMLFSGYIAEHTSLRIYLGSGMLMTGLFTIAFGMAYFFKIHTLAFFFSMQIITGMFQASGWPCVVAIVGNWFGEGRRGLVMGIWNSHVSVGNIVGSAIAGVWAGDHWGWSFVVPGCIIAGVGFVVLFFVVAHPSYVGIKINKPKIQDSQFLRIDDDMPDERTTASSTASLKSLTNGSMKEGKAIGFIGALLIPGVIEYSLCLFFAKLVSYTFLFWLPFYIKNTVIGGKIYDSEQSADLAIYFDVGGIVGGILAGYVSDKTKCSGLTCFVMLILSAPCLFLYEFHGDTSLVINIVYMVLSGIFVNGPYALITTAVSATLGNHQSLKGSTKAMATVTAIIDGTGSFGAATGPLIAGLLSNHGWAKVFYLLIASDLIAALLLLRQVYHEIIFCKSAIKAKRDGFHSTIHPSVKVRGIALTQKVAL
eukprot:gene10901-12060_t